MVYKKARVGRRTSLKTNVDDKRLDRQQAYQQFHIGIYVTLASAIIGASLFQGDDFEQLGGARYLAPIAIVLLLLAGMCGGFVASKIPASASWAEFKGTPIGFTFPGQREPWRFTLASADEWEAREHLFFWLAMTVLAVFGILINLPAQWGRLLARLAGH